MKIKKKKILSFLLVVGMLFQVFAPTLVIAATFEDGNSVTIGGNPTINGSIFEYTNGDVKITKNGTQVSTTSFTIAEEDEIVITLMPDANYTAQLHDNSKDFNIMLDNNTYSFKIGHADSNTLSYTPSFVSGQTQEPNTPPAGEAPTVETTKFDFKINGESFTNVSIGDQVVVSNNFNMDTINEFYITKIAIDGGKTYNYAPNEYSYEMLDNQGRTIFELNYTKVSDNYSNIRIESHSGDILDKDIAEGKSKEDYFGFYITNMSFVKEAFRGVEVSTAVMPDNYDFTAWNGTDLSSSTQSNPGKVSAYYGENTINFSSIVSSKIKKISLVTGSLIPSSAVEINNETGKVTILSNYYNEIPLKIELEDGTIGYITVNRIGIFISDVNAGNDTLYHGAFAPVSGNLNVDKDKNRIAAVFYHEDTTTYQDYDLIVNITYKDGNTETKIAKGVGDVHNSTGNIVGSDYILWAGNKESEPAKVSVTAVKKGATSSNSTTFSGATFGSGSGVEWKSRQGGNV